MFNLSTCWLPKLHFTFNLTSVTFVQHSVPCRDGACDYRFKPAAQQDAPYLAIDGTSFQEHIRDQSSGSRNTNCCRRFYWNSFHNSGLLFGHGFRQLQRHVDFRVTSSTVWPHQQVCCLQTLISSIIVEEFLRANCTWTAHPPHLVIVIRFTNSFITMCIMSLSRVFGYVTYSHWVELTRCQPQLDQVYAIPII